VGYGSGVLERMRHGWDLTKKAWSVVRSNPGLVKLPVTGGVLAIVVFVVVGLPGVALFSVDTAAATVGGVLLLVIAAYLATFSVIHYNVALAAAADQALRGLDPDIDAAKAIARSRRGVIAKWAAVSGLISLLMSVARDQGTLGRIVAGIGAAIWSLVTFLVVPVLAFEGVGPIDAMKRSARLFRDRWGQQVTGDVVIGGVAGIAVLVGVILGVVGIVVMAGGGVSIAVGAVLLLVGVVVAVAGAVFGGATRGVFGVALYRYVAADTVVGPFTSADLDSAAKSR
jgi:Family of unknown function (DUF6159)